MKVKDLIKQLHQVNQEARVDIFAPYNLYDDSSLDYQTDNFRINDSHSSPDEENPYIEIYCLDELGSNHQEVA